MNDAEWTAFLERPDVREIRRGMAGEFLLFAYFEARPVVGSEAETAFERRFEDRSLLFDRKCAVVIGRELLAAGAPYDGGEPEE